MLELEAAARLDRQHPGLWKRVTGLEAPAIRRVEVVTLRLGPDALSPEEVIEKLRSDSVSCQYRVAIGDMEPTADSADLNPTRALSRCIDAIHTACFKTRTIRHISIDAGGDCQSGLLLSIALAGMKGIDRVKQFGKVPRLESSLRSFVIDGRVTDDPFHIFASSSDWRPFQLLFCSQSLKVLRLSNCLLKDVDMTVMLKCVPEALEELALDRNKLKTLSVQKFPALRVLDLSWNHITDQGFPQHPHRR